MSIKEFTKAAKIYDSGKSGIYEMCKYDYPKVLKELKNNRNIYFRREKLPTVEFLKDERIFDYAYRVLRKGEILICDVSLSYM